MRREKQGKWSSRELVNGMDCEGLRMGGGVLYVLRTVHMEDEG